MLAPLRKEDRRNFLKCNAGDRKASPPTPHVSRSIDRRLHNAFPVNGLALSLERLATRAVKRVARQRQVLSPPSAPNHGCNSRAHLVRITYSIVRINVTIEDAGERRLRETIDARIRPVLTLS